MGSPGLAELVLPRRLTPDLPPAYSPGVLDRAKAGLFARTRGSPVAVARIPLGEAGSARSGLPPFAEYSRLLHPVASALVSVPISGLAALTAPTRLRLGGPLTRQLPDGPCPHPRADGDGSAAVPFGEGAFQRPSPMGD
ncbi:hypothetical protein CGL52_13690 [Pyrobaculum aerophilum]|uniref:Uncharacterized protein n=1 Tax=Pyrobaculum aerophilum TaxID=13773 RepID=A0A371QX18_9CREN|nr:hypothetical protein CGL52_13690 [Pyrobaculum aerophilum]